MPGFRIYTSNSAEKLVECLAERLRLSAQPPFQREVVVVQSGGMQRWLNLTIAEINGISANVDFPFPKRFAKKIFRDVIGLPEKYPFSPEIMTWDIMNALPRFKGLPEFECVENYIASGNSEMKSYQLARKIAEIFDQYLICRPDIIMEWDRGENSLARFPHSQWQAELWRVLSLEIGKGSEHLASMKYAFLNKMRANVGLQSLPGRVSVFGISSLPAFYMDIFDALSSKIDVDFYYLNPCREYWACAYSQKEIARFVRDEISEEFQYFDSGNNILASAGKTGREFFSLIGNLSGAQEYANFVDPGEQTMLRCVQSDILNLQNRGSDIPAKKIAMGDRSFIVNSCHSPVRELEVLHDNLLDIFDKDKTLAPRDIVVMAPDVSIYSPFIDAVFGSAEPGFENRKMPYSIADRSIMNNNKVAETFLAIFALPNGRFPASDVLDIFGTPAVSAKFGVEESALPLLRQWVIDSGIRWGVDGEFKESLGLPGHNENSWRFGLDRMLLGYALPPSAEHGLFAGSFPFDGIEGEQAKAMGALVHFVDLLFEMAESIKKDMTLKEWRERLSWMLDTFFESDKQTEKHIQEIRGVLDECGIGKISEVSSFKRKVSSEIIHDLLCRSLQGAPSRSGFFNGGITFCSLLPMRSIPFRVVCFLGMNDGDYPRAPSRAGFNLLEKHKRLCDPSKRHEDRYLFLEALLSARDCIIASYVGQDSKDNSELPPSVALSEFLDYLEDAFEVEGSVSVLEHIFVKHPLQAFSHRYFQGSSEKLFSYSAENCKAAGEIQNRKHKEPLFFNGELPPLKEMPARLPLNELSFFFHNPSRHLLEKRLKTRLALDHYAQVENCESFALDGLSEYQIKQELLTAAIAGGNLESWREIINASGALPHGCSGQIKFDGLRGQVEQFAKNVQIETDGGLLPTISSEIELNEATLSALFKNIYPKGQIFFRCAKLKPKDRLNSWILHLALNSASVDMHPRWTILFGQDAAVCYPEIDSALAKDFLSRLVKLYLVGLKRPLPFFIDTSFAYAEKMKSGGEHWDAVNAARAKWEPSFIGSGESEDVYINACFGAEFPDGDEFAETASEVLKPLLDYEEEYESQDA